MKNCVLKFAVGAIAAAYAFVLVAGPEQDFEAAYKEGKPLSAEQAFKQILEKNPNASVDLYYKAAEMATETLKSTLVRDRFAYILRKDKAWNDKTAEAAATAVVYAGDAETFARVAKAYPQSQLVRRHGTRLIWKFRDEKRPNDVLAMADVLLGAYDDKWVVDSVLNCIQSAINDRQPGFSWENLQTLLLKYPKTANSGYITWLLTCNNEKMPYEFRLDWVLKQKKLYDRGFFWDRIMNDVYNNSIVKEADRPKMLEKIAQLEPLVFASPTNGLFAVAYFYGRVRAGVKTWPMKGVAKDLRPAEWSKQTLALAEKVCQMEPKTTEMRNQVRSYVTPYLMDSNTISRDGLAPLRAKYPEMFSADNLFWNGGVGDTDRNDKTCKNVNALVGKMGGGYEYRASALQLTAPYGSAQEALKTLEEYILRNPRSFSDSTVANTLSVIPSMSPADKTAFLKKMYKQVGYSKSWNAFAGDGWKKSFKGWLDQPDFEPLRKQIKDKKGEPEHPWLKIWYPMSAQKSFSADAEKLMEAALKLYNRPYPPEEGKDANPLETAMFAPIIDKYCDLSYRTEPGRKSFVKLFADKMTKNGKWWNYEYSANNVKSEAAVNQYVENRFKILGEPNYLGSYRLPKGTDTLPDWIKDALSKCDVSPAYYFYDANCRDRLTDKGKVELFNEFWKNCKPGKMDEGWIVSLINSYVLPICDKQKDLAQKFDFEAAAKKLLDVNCNRHYPARALLRAIRTAKGPEGIAPFLNRYLATLEKEEPFERLNALIALCYWEFVDFEKNDEKKTQDFYGQIMKGKVLPLMKTVKNSEAPFIGFGGSWDFGQRLYNYRGTTAVKESSAEAKAWITDLCLESARLRSHHAQFVGDQRSWCQIYRTCFGKAFSTTNTFEMAKYAARLGQSWYGWIGGTDAFLELCGNLKGANCWESMFLLSNALSTDDGSLSAAASRMRAEAAPKLPGIYPVSEKHPAYPLYVAADELSRKNSERAWDILQKNVPVFEREAGNLPPDFTAWGVDQLRLQRGDKDALLIKARNIATALLANEAKLTPALAAAMMLVRAESYRDQQNFEAAKLEYQSIRNNPKYNASPAGRKAMFRSVDLMIDMGSASSAESTLEYWLSQPDVEVQAQAHYFLARIAFERKDYDETIKQLRETFALDFTHTEGRFLQGKWKLATNSEVDDTDVMIGTLADRTAIRPGQQLTISVQDRNLSVAGGGASIPVIVTTKPGNDVEKVYLYPSARDPNLFKGVIDVKLAPAVCSNMVLEVTGKDSASYVIEPDFLKARGLPLNKPKVLQVIDDAKLEIENETLRPGNPLYVTVEDKDRSMGGADDEVTVKVTTSSGDVLKAFPLKEEKPYTGVFRGEVKTSLPPPRAFASDTAVGFNPGDVINETKTGEWKSLADNQPGKWLEVDTMASHLMKTAKIDVPNPEEIREIALVGRLGTETIRLGSLPQEPVEKRLGLRLHSCWHHGISRSEHDIRARFAAMSPRESYTRHAVVSNGVSFSSVAKKGQSIPQFAWYTGAFMAPTNVTFIRFRVMAKKTQGDTFRNLWMSVSLDGENVFSGQGPTLHGRIISMDVAPGAHQLEVFASCYREEDGFDLELVDENDEGKPIPADWFSDRSHGELRDFLRDRAVIVRTNEGFVATFERPMRLRSLRWEFQKRTTPDVTVSKMAIVDSKGNTVIPCASDFTDAQKNDTLEVAPGDKISVAYTDSVTSLGEKRVLEKSINSSFNNAKVGFFYEEIVKTGTAAGLHLREASRFHTGDKLLVGVYDPDMDASGGEDKLKVVVTTSGGEKKELVLLEQNKDYAEFRNYRDINWEKRIGCHSGLFLALLRTCDPSSTNDVKALKVAAGEALTLSYHDRENTSPGVPFVRQAKVLCVKAGAPQIQFFHTRKMKEVDKSPQAKARLEKIRRRPGNEQVKVLYRDVQVALPMDRKTCDSKEPIDVNVATPIPIRVIDPSRALHNTSKVMLEAVSDSEIAKAKAEGREPEKVVIPLVVGGPFTGFRLKKGGESPREAQRNGSFNGVLELCLGAPDPNRIVREDDPPQLPVTGSDTITVRVVEKGQTLVERRLRFVSNGALQLMDSTWSAERMAAHVGERFYVCVEDPDRDASDEQDKLTVRATSLAGTNDVELVETLPHSGVFTGTYPSKKYGDQVIFRYNDERVLPGTQLPRTLCATGTVYSGSDGAVRLFSKRFRDNDTAVLVQFRLAECLFEQAKEFRKLKNAEKAQEAIAEGKYILEEALKNYPDSTHVVQGEYLLANLYQELATERKDAKDMSGATPLYTEALARFSSILSAWPDSEYAAKAQFHKALCLEMLGDYPRSSEEYVKMTYLYPDSDLVGDATIRLATYYYKQEKRYDIAGRIYENFQKRFPTHEKAPRTLFMSGSCYVKQAEKVQAKYEEETKRTTLCKEASDLYLSAAKSFAAVAEKYRESAPPAMRAQALYWTGDTYLRRQDFQQSYMFLKRTVFEYPETEWARRARGLLLQESSAFERLEAQ